MKKLVYICSPCRGDIEKNLDNAATYSRAAFMRGYIPITPHLYFTRFMDDNNEKERIKGLSAGLQLLLMCSEVWVFGLDHPSEGMQGEIALAIRRGIPIRDGEEILAEGRSATSDFLDHAALFFKAVKKTPPRSSGEKGGRHDRR